MLTRLSTPDHHLWQGGRIAAILSAALVLVWVPRIARAEALDLAITEVHYNVFAEGVEAQLEFVELQNRGPQPVDVSGFRFAQGLTYSFPQGTVIEPFEYVVISPDPAAARTAYGIDRVFGPWLGSLDNGGEILTLVDAGGRLINRVHYGDGGAWPSRPDGRGPSLELTTREGPNDQGRHWRPSTGLNGTPGAANSRLLPKGEHEVAPSPYLGGLINEVRATTPGQPGFIEVYNSGDAVLALAGALVVSSDFTVVYEFPAGTSLPPGGFLVIPDAATGPVPTENLRYLLLSSAREVLDDLGTTYIADRSFGRFPDGDRDAHVLDNASPSAPNAYTEDRRVVINEIAYHPTFVEPSGDCTRRCSDALQWIELHNPGDSSVDLGAWRLTNAIDFDFPAGSSIEAGAYLVIAADRAAFQASFPAVSPVLGDWVGRLSHASETIVLRNALGNPVDRVEYGDGGPINDQEPADGVDDQTIRGFWDARADGGGPTLELIHPGISNRAGVAWRASSDDDGTPGARNSRYDSTPDPTIRNVEHEPAVPTSTQPVRITCRISSLGALANTRVDWRVDGGGANGSVDLQDDGIGADAQAGDGEFSAEIPAQDDGDIVRFRIVAEDGGGRTTRLPLEPSSPPYGGYTGTWFLYEVDDGAGPDSGIDVIRVILRAADLNELQDRSVQSDVLLPATFIADGRVHYLAGVRYRGENSRNSDNVSIKVRLRSEDEHEGRDNLNFNAGNGGSQDVSGFREIVSTDVFRRADMPFPQTWPVAMHFPGQTADFDTRYIYKEAFDDDFLSRTFGGSSDGSFYRAIDPGGNAQGSLQYYGDDDPRYAEVYDKKTDREEADYSDIIALCRLFNAGETPLEEFAARIGDEVDVRQWARFFAVMACVNNADGGIWRRSGEDYFLYRVPDDSPRPDAGKWLLLPWDLEETWANANEELFRSSVVAIVRFFSIEENSRLYYDELRKVRDGPFSRLQMRKRFRAADLMFEPEAVFNVVDVIDTNITNRIGYIDSRVSWKLEAGAVGTEPGVGATVIGEGDTWRYFRGTQNPAGVPNAWTERNYDDSGWNTGASGFGYSDGDDATVLDDMENNYSTVYIRRIFDIPDPGNVNGLVLRVDYDDAFVAYLNGTEVARSDNAPGGAVIPFDATSNGNHEASAGGLNGNDPEDFDLSPFFGDLVAGENQLALVGINGSLGSGDFSLIPELLLSESNQAGGPAGGCGDRLYVQGGSTRLEGVCDPAATRSVTVDGQVRAVTLIIDGDGPWGARWSADISVPAGSSSVQLRARDTADGGGSILDSETLTVERVQSFRAVSGTIDGDETWTRAQGPYRVTNTVTVASSGSLTIEAGTVVLFDEDESIIVHGEFNATGTAAQPIRMLAYRCGESWGGIAFDDTGRGDGDPEHQLHHVVIRDGDTPEGFAGCIAVVNSKVSVADCEISEISDNAIDGTDAVLDIERVWIHDIFEGVHCNTSVTRLRDSTIERMIGNSDAIDFDGSGPSRSLIEGCLLRDSSDDGIDLGNVTVDIRDNVIVRIGDKAISIEGNGAQGGGEIVGNLVTDSGAGMALKNGLTVTVAHHNTVVACQEGIFLFAKDFAADGGHAEFHSTIAWGSVCDLIVDDRSSVAFAQSNIGGDEVVDGPGNLLADPLFANPRMGDWSLSAGSPSRGTGRDGTDMGAIPFEPLVEGLFIRGDADANGSVNLTDVIFTLDFLFRMGTGPIDCLDRSDANDDGNTDVSDGIFSLLFLFSGGEPIPAPYPEAGLDPTPDANTCLPGA